MSVEQLEKVTSDHYLNNQEELKRILDEAAGKIAPLWSLESFVTVNPYHGMIDSSFEKVAQRLESVSGARTTMPQSFYLDALRKGSIKEKHLQAVLSKRELNSVDRADQFIELIQNTDSDESKPDPSVPTVADVATEITGTDWKTITKEQVSDWAAAYFDEGQAFWKSISDNKSIYQAWKAEAKVDRSPEVLGLEDFREEVASLPDDPMMAAQKTLYELNIPREGLDYYLHRLLMRVGGWSSYCARKVFESSLNKEEDDSAIQFLTVLLSWEYALLRTLPESNTQSAWNEAKLELNSFNHSTTINSRIKREIILLEAYERSEQEHIQEKLQSNSESSQTKNDRPSFQSVFCIDVRSEVYRRHLESIGGNEIETFGFPGFFGIPIHYKPLAHKHTKKQCPPPLTSDYTIPEVVPDESKHDNAIHERQQKHHLKRAWDSFKWGAISCFSFVGPLGLAYLPKLYSDAFGLSRTVPHPEDESLSEELSKRKEPNIEPEAHSHNGEGIPLEDRVDLAEDALNAMSITETFGELVMITGHGATTVNNPYDSALDCGACGGNAGSANAQVAAKILNDDEVRQKLSDRGIEIPTDTFFLAGKHDTTTDEISVLNRENVPSEQEENLHQLETWLQEATKRTRQERAERFNIVSDNSVQNDVKNRSQDWSQVRPEWGLAGCSSFIVAPRERTRNIDLEGRTFLHNYKWKQDNNFDVLELIMTAPMVVTTWISLQYYASTVDNEQFGSGNKTLHNVVGRLGVFEGNAGNLRTGLPWQSLHDGENYQHIPLRQSVIIEAPIDAMNDIINEHETVRYLCDHQWLHLLAMNEEGTISKRYTSNLNWRNVSF